MISTETAILMLERAIKTCGLALPRKIQTAKDAQLVRKALIAACPSAPLSLFAAIDYLTIYLWDRESAIRLDITKALNSSFQASLDTILGCKAFDYHFERGTFSRSARFPEAARR